MYEALTVPPAFPALGHDVSTDYRTHPVDLSAQKLSLSAPNHHAYANESLSSIARTQCYPERPTQLSILPFNTAGDAGLRNVGPASGKVNHNSAAPATALQRHHDDHTRDGVTTLDMELGWILD
jgi:hypothetical protein